MDGPTSTAGFLQALAQLPLRPNSLRVLLYAAGELDTAEFRPLKQHAVARALRMSQTGVSMGILGLVHAGLLEPGEPDGATKRYRLRPIVQGSRGPSWVRRVGQ